MQTKSRPKGLHRKNQHKPLARLTVVALLVGLFGIAAPVAHAVDFDAQIRALQGKINENTSAANQKRAEADTLANKVAALNAEIAAAQSALNLTRTEISQTEQEIAATTAELEKQTNNLRENIKAMYKDRDVTPMEVLASSENLSDFVGKQQYMDDLKTKIESNIAAVNKLKGELEARKTALAQKADQEKSQVVSIAAKRSEQQALLNQTRGEEAAYQNLVKQNQSQLSAVFAARAAEIARNQSQGGSYSGGGACGGGYPGFLCNRAQDSVVDPWGYYNRECVSYAAWKRSALGRMVPMYWGNAGDWYRRTNSSSPAPGDIAAWPYAPGYPYGHVAIVESVNGGMMTISEYNYGAPGQYSVRTISTSYLGVRFIK